MPESGKVKWFNPKKGFGFITPNGSSTDVFVHYTAIKAVEGAFKTLNQDDEVTFETADGRKGKEARDVVVTKAAPRQPRGGGRGDGYGRGRGGGDEEEGGLDDDSDEDSD